MKKGHVLAIEARACARARAHSILSAVLVWGLDGFYAKREREINKTEIEMKGRRNARAD